MTFPDIRDREPQPALVVFEEVLPAELGASLARFLPAVHRQILSLGGTPAGAPFTRYTGFAGEGRLRIEAGLPTLEPLSTPEPYRSIILDGGPCVSLMHQGPYAHLAVSHVILDEWFLSTGRRPAGYRWEAYLTDPGSEPDPSKWQTLITQAIES